MNFLIFLEDKLDDVLYENIENRIPKILPILLGKKSKWIGKKKYETEEEQTKKATELIYRLKEFDPTNTDKFAPFLAKQVANGSLPDEKVEEDGPNIKSALNIFLHKRKTWPGQNDLMAYKDYREFISDAFRHADEIESSEQANVKKQSVEAQALKHVEKVYDDGEYTVYRSSDPVAIAKMSRAGVTDKFKEQGVTNQWCTTDVAYRSKKDTHNSDIFNIDWNDQASVDKYKKMWFGNYPYYPHFGSIPKFMSELKYLPWDSIDDVMAEIDAAAEGKTDMVPNLNYLGALKNGQNYSRSGPVYIIMKNGKSHMQLSPDGSEFMSPDNRNMATVGKFTAKVLFNLLNREDTPEGMKDRIKSIFRTSLNAKRDAAAKG